MYKKTDREVRYYWGPLPDTERTRVKGRTTERGVIGIADPMRHCKHRHYC